MKKYIPSFLPLLLFISCSQNKNNTDDAGLAKDSTEKVSFFPVTPFLQAQIQLLDSLPVTVLQLTSNGDKQDSAWLPVEKVKPMLKAFVADTIDKENLALLFKEIKFNDQSTEAITLMYSPKADLPGNIALRRWDVYVDPEKGTVKRVFIIKQGIENNIPVTKQLTWQTGKWAKIVTIKNDSSAKPQEVRWVWDLNEAPVVPIVDNPTSTSKEK